MSTESPVNEAELRERAVRRLRKKSDFRTHLMIYLAFNAVLVVIWAMTWHGFFWPIFPILGWGVGVVANAWDVYRRDEIDEDRVRREMDRLRRNG
jgi:CHASE2 domain-containing sensor protein